MTESAQQKTAVYPENVHVEETWPAITYPKVIKRFDRPGTGRPPKYVAHCAGEDYDSWQPFRHWLEVLDESGRVLARGHATIFDSIASIEDEGETFLAVTSYFEGVLKHEEPLRAVTGTDVPNKYLIVNRETRHNHMWYCRDCEFKCIDVSAAAYHTEDFERGSAEHWLFEHPDFDKTKPPVAEMHASDQGFPPYITDLSPDMAKMCYKSPAKGK